MNIYLKKKKNLSFFDLGKIAIPVILIYFKDEISPNIKILLDFREREREREPPGVSVLSLKMRNHNK